MSQPLLPASPWPTQGRSWGSLPLPCNRFPSMLCPSEAPWSSSPPCYLTSALLSPLPFQGPRSAPSSWPFTPSISWVSYSSLSAQPHAPYQPPRPLSQALRTPPAPPCPPQPGVLLKMSKSDEQDCSLDITVLGKSHECLLHLWATKFLREVWRFNR